MQDAVASRLARRLLIIGWDAADWTFIDPLMGAGAMPHLSALVKSGLRSGLATLDPKLSPLLWTTVATGKTADRHGILNFVEPDPAGTGLRLASSTSRRTKAIWNVLSQCGLRTNVVSWYASHPAEPIRGVCISNQFTTVSVASDAGDSPLPPQCVHPESERDAVASLRVGAGAVEQGGLAEFVAGEPSAKDPEDARLRRALATHLAQARSVHAVGMHLLQRGDWDCTMVFHDLIDALGHHFMEYAPPRMRHIPLERFNRFSNVMSAAYREQDRMLGEMLRAAGPGTTVMILSDHGFHNGDSRPVMDGAAMSGSRLDAEALWHRPLGMLAMAGPGIAAGACPVHPGLLDIAPTAMALLGVGAGQDMPGRVLAESLAGPAPARVASWDEIAGDAGMHPPDARQDPFEQHAAIQQLVELGYMRAMPEDLRARIEHVRRECEFNRAVTLSTTGRIAEAVPVFESLLAVAPDNVRYALSLADCLHRAGRFEECAAAVQPLLPMDKDDRPLHLTSAIALTFAGRHAEAAAVTDSLRSDDADGCAGIGDLCVMQGRADAAERWYRRALKFDGRHWRSHAGLAQVALMRDRLEACANHCMDAAGIDPRAWTPHYLLGVALAWYGDLPSALQSFQLAAQINPCSRTLHRYLSLVHREMGNAEAAARNAAEAERLGAMLNRATDLLATMPRTPEEWESKLASGGGAAPKG